MPESQVLSSLKPLIRTRKDATNSTGGMTLNDALNARVGSSNQEEKPNQNDNYIQC